MGWHGKQIIKKDNMDIIRVNQQTVKAAMDECAFEINCILGRPKAEGSLEKLDKTTARYSRLSAQLQILKQLEAQIEENPSQDES